MHLRHQFQNLQSESYYNVGFEFFTFSGFFFLLKLAVDADDFNYYLTSNQYLRSWVMMKV